MLPTEQIRTEYQANESLSTTDAKRYAHLMGRVNYAPARSAGPVEICVKLAAMVGVIVAIAFLLAH